MTAVARPIDGYPPIVVLFGGPSAEHDVSIVSGTAIAAGLRTLGLTVGQVLVDLEGQWWWLPPGHLRDDHPPADYDDPAAFGAEGPLTVGTALDRLAHAAPRPLVFVALHGPFGEDGTVQALLESIEVPYTGAGITASALGMDKALFKRLARGLGLPVADWREIPAVRWPAERDGVLAELEAFASAGNDPRLMIKPARLGSSLGMSIAHHAGERAASLEEAFRFDTLVLAERYLPHARELEVAVLGNDGQPIEDYGPGEVVSSHEFYDYAAKYTPGLSDTSPHAELAGPERAMIRKIARDAYRAVGAEGFARVDFLFSAGHIYLSEINTIPGFTPTSLFPAVAADGGYDFAGVCRRIIDLAIQRHESRISRRLTADDLPR